jgi:uracil-DNA glycosylase
MEAVGSDGERGPAENDAETRLTALEQEVIACTACPRLVEWRETVAEEKRAAFRDEEYWGRPVPGFGDPGARLLIVGLAPAAHGANRTGRMFTGDRSGDWLFGALHRAGFASQPDSRSRGDGLELHDAWLTAALRCAPPLNRPTAQEMNECQHFLEDEIATLLPSLRCIVALGGIAHQRTVRALKNAGLGVPTPRPPFGHGEEAFLTPGLLLLASYHPSQQNTFTGRLTREAFDSIWTRAREVVGT